MEKRKNIIDDDVYISLGNLLLDKLKGKINLKVSPEERWHMAEEGLKQIIQRQAFSQYSQIYQHFKRKKEFLDRFFSYDEIDSLLSNNQVEDISINSTNPIFIHTTDKGAVRTPERFKDLRYLDFFVKKLVIFSGRTHLGKVNDLELPYIQGRVNIVYSPYGHQVTITKAKQTPLTIIQLIERKTLDYKTAAFLWLAVEGMGLRPANILIVGGPGAGKTTLLNALLNFVPSNERVVTIEDTLELNTQLMDNFSRLESDEELSLEDLVKNTLRMRPDRLIIGEVRGTEARDMMTAMNIGKYCMGTIHASNTKEAFARLEHDPMNVSPPLLNLIDILVVLRRYKKTDGFHRIIEELSETSFLEQRRPLVSVLWKYDYSENYTRERVPFTIYREKLAEATGKDALKILQEWEDRAKILYVLKNRKISSFSDLTRFFSAYNNNKAQSIENLGLSLDDLRSMPAKFD